MMTERFELDSLELNYHNGDYEVVIYVKDNNTGERANLNEFITNVNKMSNILEFQMSVLQEPEVLQVVNKKIIEALKIDWEKLDNE